MLLTMPSARLPCSAILPRLPVSSVHRLVDLGALVSSSVASAGAAVSFSSSSSSTERAAKLLTKFSGFLISCAMPAVSWPSEAIFSDWTRLACAALSRSSDSRNSVNSRTFSMAITAWAAKVSSSSIWRGVERPASRPAQRDGSQWPGLVAQHRRGQSAIGSRSCAPSSARPEAASHSSDWRSNVRD